MSISKELGDSTRRFKASVDRLIALVQDHNIDSIPGLVDAFRNNEAFSTEWKSIWADIAKADGGKISLGTAGAIIGSVLGGVGIAAMGGAFGLPLALVLGLGGFVAGAEVDSVRALTQTKLHLLRVPKEVYSRIDAVSKAEKVSNNEMIVKALWSVFPGGGAEVDSVRAVTQTKYHLLRVPKELYSRIDAASKAEKVSNNEMIVKALWNVFPEIDEFE
jgi:predicted HicB family RNase H-like nuclease